jgi:hypothetical protein
MYVTTRAIQLVVCAGLLLGSAPCRVISAPTTAPATQPTAKDADLAKWIADLDAKSPDARSAAATKLLQISRDDLPALQRAVEHSRPISPGQAPVLHDVVIHVWLSGEPYPRQETGFLGVSLMPTNGWDDANGVVDGVFVLARMPGFAAYGALLDSDLILGIQERPGMRFNRVDEFALTIARFKPGTLLHLVVLRESRQIVVPIRLSARPNAAGDLMAGRADMDTLLGERMLAAEKYYDENFARLLGDEISQAD